MKINKKSLYLHTFTKIQHKIIQQVHGYIHYKHLISYIIQTPKILIKHAPVILMITTPVKHDTNSNHKIHDANINHTSDTNKYQTRNKHTSPL